MKALEPLLHISADGFTYLRFHSCVCVYILVVSMPQPASSAWVLSELWIG